MTVVSASFLIFLACTTAAYYIAGYSWRWVVLLATSIGFYVYAAGWAALPWMLFVSLISWVCARQVDTRSSELRIRQADPSVDRETKRALERSIRRSQRMVVVLVIVVCLSGLLLTKFNSSLDRMLIGIGQDGTIPVPLRLNRLLMPLGISYYTFMCLGYVLDVLWGRYRAEGNFLRFLSFVCYFPHIMQGPISRYNLLAQSMRAPAPYDERNIIHGTERIIWGFFKKLVIADRMAIFVRTVYDGVPHAGSVYLVAMLMDAFMIYMDFSGYMEIVCGASQLFGIELEENFDRPFFSRTVAEFWRHWHMSLGSWFKDYVYYPISVSGWMKALNRHNRKRHSRRFTRVVSVAIPCMATWVLTGLWHGTGWNYVLWGVYYGVLITISNAFSEEFASIDEWLGINPDARPWQRLQMWRTFLIFVGGRVLTSPGSLERTGMVFDSILHDLQLWQWFDESLYTYGLTSKDMGLLAVCMLIVWLVSRTRDSVDVRELIDRTGPAKWLLICLGIMSVVVFGVYGPEYDATAFIYMRY